HLARDATGFDGVAFSAPFFGFSIKVPAWKSLMGRALSGLTPKLGLPTDIPPEHVSHDPEVIHAYATDPLIGGVATARWFTETIKAHRALIPRLGDIKLPTLMQLAGEDKIASTPTAKARFEALGAADKTCLEYPGLYHEIWFERARQAPLADLSAWLKARAERSTRA
ncbi:lysophospholipase, partial [Myxococcota bacterium]|nr:lysophospholipase [Myxococcota bacterium]